MAGMTPRMRAGSDPVNGVVRPPAAAAPAGWTDLDDAVRRIGEHALTANVARAYDVQEALTLASAGRLDDDRRQAAVRAAHQLVGSAGTFGFPRASDLAGQLEEFLAHGLFAEPHLQSAADQATALLAELASEPDY
jgi:HPt (histidine-containing phosphotransfer) domain-containing protein